MNLPSSPKPVTLEMTQFALRRLDLLKAALTKVHEESRTQLLSHHLQYKKNGDIVMQAFDTAHIIAMKELEIAIKTLEFWEQSAQGTPQMGPTVPGD